MDEEFFFLIFHCLTDITCMPEVHLVSVIINLQIHLHGNDDHHHMCIQFQHITKCVPLSVCVGFGRRCHV
jgi:hypothetical protein